MTRYGPGHIRNDGHALGDLFFGDIKRHQITGQGYRAAEEGKTARLGPRPINSSGGLKSKGHPVGATGAGQVVEIWKQLRGEAGERQVPGSPAVGMTHNLGGSGQACAVHIFERRA